MSQMIFVDEEEYKNFKSLANICCELIEDIDNEASNLYPDVKYWLDTGTNADVAFIQFHKMVYEIKKYRKYRNKKILNKIKKMVNKNV